MFTHYFRSKQVQSKRLVYKRFYLQNIRVLRGHYLQNFCYVFLSFLIIRKVTFFHKYWVLSIYYYLRSLLSSSSSLERFLHASATFIDFVRFAGVKFKNLALPSIPFSKPKTSQWGIHLFSKKVADSRWGYFWLLMNKKY